MSNLITSSTIARALEKLSGKFFGLGLKEAPKLYDVLFSKTDSESVFFHATQLAGAGFATKLGPGEIVPNKTVFYQGDKAWVPDIYGGRFEITRAAMEDAIAVNIAELCATELARMMTRTLEQLAANVITNSTTGTTGADGIVLASASHPAVGAANNSNLLSTASALVLSAVEDMITQIMENKANDGSPAPLKPQKLVVHPGNAVLANRIVKSIQRPGTNFNDVNVVKDFGLSMDVVVDTFLTNSSLWGMTTDAPEGLMYLERRAVDIGRDNAFDTDNVKMKATWRGVFGWKEWRGIYISAGTS